ncbi:retron Ec67 family RNA-directed DNA polymerase/endonuclease [Fusobacterium canifelinum]|uniref:RNA-directed DNA polymerase n=1 Tax=Fusobacterium canifelinum TaxID=285729 RepID=A0ABX7CMI0_9FUSO|nr:retron Ec67 family RNA-directed DNA polymerase/endonuclease [Fusobacterium canifelinum]QQS88574.1 retron Ec67 family RNA-directed DNA polymerase/endonuclease [Fusobacterium canifelinum]
MFNFKNAREILSKILNIHLNYLSYILYVKKIENLYTTFKIPKKNGGYREINAPQNELKMIQKKFVSFLEEKMKEKFKTINTSHGFVKERSIITNAKIHKNKKIVLNLDLKDFFDSFHFGRVKGFFEKNKDFKSFFPELTSELSTLIAQLVCFNGKLPQGAPSSPLLTNLICNIFDVRVLKLAKKYKLTYSRYADDLTFSTNYKGFIRNLEKFEEDILLEIKKNGFEANMEKYRLTFQSSRQEVTGLTVNKKINVSRKYYKYTRAMAYSLYKNGEFNIDGIDGTINQLEGRFSFINQLDKYNNSESEKRKKFIARNVLNSREKQYQNFLFYKYFFMNEKPLIVTEGKTDILYIKAALKNLYNEYPNLITKEENEFIFKISFLKRTKLLKYFFNLSPDGADSMKNIYNYFGDKNSKFYDFYNYFKKLTNLEALNPVILVFDNEATENSKKPLKKFLNHIFSDKNDNDKKNLISYVRTKFKLKIINNLYLLTINLVDGLEECEIEDLFFEDTYKKFSFDKINPNKDKFSKNILKNYKNIDFSKFKPFLNNLESILKEYNKKD